MSLRYVSNAVGWHPRCLELWVGALGHYCMVLDLGAREPLAWFRDWLNCGLCRLAMT